MSRTDDNVYMLQCLIRDVRSGVAKQYVFARLDGEDADVLSWGVDGTLRNTLAMAMEIIAATIENAPDAEAKELTAKIVHGALDARLADGPVEEGS